MTAPQPSPTYEPALRGLLGAAAVVIVVAGLKLASAVFVPVTIALFLAMVSLPLLEWLVRHRVNRAVAVTITALADLGVIVFFGWLLAVAVHDVTLDQFDVCPLCLCNGCPGFAEHSRREIDANDVALRSNDSRCRQGGKPGSRRRIQHA